MMLEPFENFVPLLLPNVPVNSSALQWHRYNPRKEISRWGSSITSLDGKNTGVPDLDSIYEYNKVHKTSYREGDFKTLTEAGQPFEFLTQLFDLGRSHFIKLGPGGYFPYHRDLDPNTFRLVYCVENCDPSNFVWIHNEKVLKLQDGGWFYINTKMPHATFAFNSCIFAVFNVVNNEKAICSLMQNLSVK